MGTESAAGSVIDGECNSGLKGRVKVELGDGGEVLVAVASRRCGAPH